MLQCRIPTTPHKLLNPNQFVSKKDRDQLDWPLPVKSTSVIKFALRRQLREFSAYSAMGATPPKPLSGPVVLRFIIAWERKRQKLDWDNAVGTLKGVIDGLVDAGFMVDDDQVVGIFLTQTKDPAGTGYIDVTVEPVAASESEAA